MILLLINSRWSSGKRTKHITDPQTGSEVILTKPKQGTGYQVNRANLMKVPEDYGEEAEGLATNPALLPTDNAEHEEEVKTNDARSPETTEPMTPEVQDVLKCHCKSVSRHRKCHYPEECHTEQETGSDTGDRQEDWEETLGGWESQDHIGKP